VIENRMADTRVQLEVEDWVRQQWMPTKYGMNFYRERLKIRSGGVFDFDAVSRDKSIIATISTSGAKTSGRKLAVGKIMKIRSDMLFLTMVETKQRVVVLTEQDMYEQCLKEKAGGRVPPEIDFAFAPLPAELNERLLAARLKTFGADSDRAGRRTQAVINGKRRGYEQPVGEYLKFLVWAQPPQRRGPVAGDPGERRPIACLAWSSAPRHLGSRDRYIGLGRYCATQPHPLHRLQHALPAAALGPR
jgi:hypothetical protein